MRILFFSNLYPPDYIGGYEIGTAAIAKELARLGHDIYIISRRPKFVFKSFDAKGTKIVNPKVLRLLISNWDFSWRYSGLSGRLRYLKNVATGMYFNPSNFAISRIILREICPDVVSYWNPAGISLSPMFATLKQKIPMIIHVSDGWMAKWLGKSFAVPRANIHVPNILHTVLLRKLKHQAKIIAISSYIKSLLLEQGFLSSNITVVNYGVDTNLFKPMNVEKPNIFTILYVGRIVFPKGIHNIIIALAKILKKDKNVQLLIAGDVDEDEEYFNYLKKLIRLLRLTNNVSFLGKISHADLPSIYNKANVFVYPSIYPEPQGMAILEAMACGVPVVASNIGGIPDMIRNNENGFLVKANDPIALAEAITILKENPETTVKIREKGLKVVRERFTWEIIAQRVLQEYEDIAGRF